MVYMHPSHRKPSVAQHSQTGSTSISPWEHSARTPTWYDTGERSNGAHGVLLELAAQYDLPWSGDAVQVVMLVHALMPAVLRCSHTLATSGKGRLAFLHQRQMARSAPCLLSAVFSATSQPAFPRHAPEHYHLFHNQGSTSSDAQWCSASCCLLWGITPPVGKSPSHPPSYELLMHKTPPTTSFGHPLIDITIWLSGEQTSANFLKWSTWELAC